MYPALVANNNSNNIAPTNATSNHSHYAAVNVHTQNEVFAQFQAINTVQQLHRGQFVIPSFLPDSPHTSSSTGHVDIARWNKYWEQFSEKASDHEAAVKKTLLIEETSAGTQNGAGEGRVNRRRIVVKLSQALPINKIIHVALEYGAQENVIVRSDEMSLQFTTSTAALTFMSVIKTFARNFYGADNANGVPPTATPDGQVMAFPTDAWQVRNSESSNVLVLGSNVSLPPMYIDALFVQLYDAKRTENVNGSYVITFEGYSEARYALHSLQTSLYFVFGLTLQFAMLPLRFDGH